MSTRILKRRLTAALFGLGLAVAADVPPRAGANVPSLDTPIRLGISDQVVRGVNRGDAAAAIAVWASEMAKAVGLKLAPEKTWLVPSDEILSAVRNGSLDLFCLTVLEYRRVRGLVDTSRILTDGGDELQILVREDSGIVNLGGLKGRSMIVLDSPYTMLADPWLALSFRKEGLESPPKVLGRITRNTRMAQLVLPVFFGQADACIAP
jgi:hypothetical protein